MRKCVVTFTAELDDDLWGWKDLNSPIAIAALCQEDIFSIIEEGNVTVTIKDDESFDRSVTLSFNEMMKLNFFRLIGKE